MNIPAVANAPPMNAVTLIPRRSVRTPAAMLRKNVMPMAEDIVTAEKKTSIIKLI